MIAMLQAMEISEVCEEPEVSMEACRESTRVAATKDEGRRKHLAKLLKNQVYDAQQRRSAGSKPLTGRWVDKDLGYMWKSRYVAHGFKQVHDGKDYYCATPNPKTMRALLVVAHARGWIVGAGDAEDAFLQAVLEEEVYMECPPEFDMQGEDLVWKLLKAIPGLRGSPDAWRDHVERLLKDEFTQSVADPCLYRREGAIPSEDLFVLRHMDDFLFFGMVDPVKDLVARLEEQIHLRDVQYLEKNGDEMIFLAIHIKKETDGFHVAVKEDLIRDLLKENGLQDSKGIRLPAEQNWRKHYDDTEASAEQHRWYRHTVGQYLFLAAWRPDLQEIVHVLARKVGGPTVSDIAMAKRVLRYLAGTVYYSILLGSTGPERTEGQCDSDWAGGLDRKSTSGGVIFYCGSWVFSYSRCQATPALSSCEAELYGLGSIAAEIFGFDQFLKENRLVAEGSRPQVWMDSQSALQLSGRTGPGKAKHLELRFLAVQQWRKDGRLSVGKLHTDVNVSDFLTKPLGLAKFLWCCKQLRLG